MADEEGHIDFLETQLGLVKKLGEPLYMHAHLAGLGEGGTPGLRSEG